MKHANISIFVPHEGCKMRCTFCNQNAITGVVTASDIEESVNKASDPVAEIAFFGGSFTLIEREYMLRLLDCAKEQIDKGKASAIRMSTRPDGINDEILTLLKNYPISVIELGCQSMDDDVLAANRRGHNARCVKDACALIKRYGFGLGLQMMTGLYKSTPQKDLFTADEIVKLSPDCVRIYPAVVIENTELEFLYKRGEYRPQTVEEAVELAATVYEKFLSENINVIRVGLHTVEDFVAGPYHPAFGEMVQSKMMLNRALSQMEGKGDYEIYVAENFISKMVGQRRLNIEILQNSGYNCTVYKKDLPPFCVQVKKCI
ncbi:MAG: radical SAM protein [Oscillospiraceae bacterium]|nr:radical SAM protein [Candidatus Equicaccousia limihippi]